MSRIIDLSQPIVSGMPVYPGDEATELKQTRFLTRDFHNNHQLSLGMHSGTHVDGPMHLLPGQTYISEVDLAPFAGSGSLLDVRGQQLISWRPEYESLVKPGGVLLLYTGHASCYGSTAYYDSHPCVDPGFCDFLLEKQVTMLGMDLPSPDLPPFPVHKRLLQHGVYILENLINLEQLLGIAQFEVIALPLRVRADSSPVRAVAKVD